MRSIEVLKRLLQHDNNLYVCDISWMLHRSFHSFNNMSVNINGYARPTGHLYGVLSTIKMIQERDNKAIIIMCQDGVPVERNAIMAASGDIGYKEGRAELEFDFYKDLPMIRACACSLPNVFWAFNEDLESDDCMYALAKQAESISEWKGHVYVHSGDNDLLQTIDDRVSVIRHVNGDWWDEITNDTVTTDEKFTKKFHGVDTKHIVNFRAICGDPSDRIKGIPRFPRDIAVKIAMNNDSIMDHCLFEPETERERTWAARLTEEKETVQRNYRLMKLSEEHDIHITKPIVDLEKLESMVIKPYQLNSFRSYLKEVSNGKSIN